MSQQTKNFAAVLHQIASPLVTEEVPTPKPGPNDVLIRNHAIAVNPVDWKRQAWGFAIPSYPVILGSDVSGIIASVGPSVTLFKPGDRVLGYSNSFKTGLDKDGAFQTYTIVSQELVAKLPNDMSFEDGAVLPLAVGTAAISLFDNLGLPLPTSTSKSRKKQNSAILIWSGASSVGSVSVQIAALAGYTVFATASETQHEYLKTLGATEVFDYRSPTVASDLLSAATKAGKAIAYALDTFSDTLSTTLILEILSKSGGKGSKLARLLPLPELETQPDGIAISSVSGETIFGNDELSTWAYGNFLTEALESGSFAPSPKVQIVDGGLDGLQAAMDLSKSGVSGTKLVVKLD